jgi:hypothetical protein
MTNPNQQVEFSPYQKYKKFFEVILEAEDQLQG